MSTHDGCSVHGWDVLRKECLSLICTEASGGLGWPCPASPGSADMPREGEVSGYEEKQSSTLSSSSSPHDATACHLETTVPETLPSTLPAIPAKCSRTCSQQVVFPAPLRPRATMLWSLRWLSSAQYARWAREVTWAGRPSRRPLGTCRKMPGISLPSPAVPRENPKTVPTPASRSHACPPTPLHPCQRGLASSGEEPSLSSWSCA